MTPANRTLLALSLLLCVGQPLFAHNGEPAPRPMVPTAPMGDTFRTVHPPRWSWVHWWEANRDRFLQPPQSESARSTTEPVATTQQAAATQESDPLRIEAVRLLLDVIDKSDNEALVEQATLAIGKIQYRTAIPLLGAEAAKSKSQRVRRAALVALGLIGGPEAEIQILAFNPTTVDDRLAAITALGLLPALQASTIASLQGALTPAMNAPANQNNPLLNGPTQTKKFSVADAQTATTICWALRQHPVRGDLKFYQGIIFNNQSPWVVSEAITALGDSPDATPSLAKILLGDQSAIVDVAAWNVLDQITRQKASGANRRATLGTNQQQYDKAYADYLKRYQQYQKTNPNAPPVQQKGRVIALPPTAIGEEQIFIGDLRSSAAIALGHTNREDARDALLQFLEPSSDEYLFAPRDFSIMALTQYANEQTRDKLILLLGKKDPQGKMQLEGAPNDPTRGFAALALGMYAQTYDTPSGPADRPDYPQALIALAERLDDPQDTLETRCACAVALGLSRRTEVLPVLVKTTQKLNLKQRNTDELLYGFLLLGRALAGDHNLLEPATGLLVRQGDETSTAGILSRRAGVLALGVMKSSAVVPILTQAWHLNYWVNREVIISLKLVGATGTAKPIMDRLRNSKDPKEQAYMAQALGELLAKEQPTRLTRLMAESNFTVRNDPAEPLKEYANEFLFAYLIPCFGDTWR
jgi:HEAT repeat protein